jgi:hypothetical protein
VRLKGLWLLQLSGWGAVLPSPCMLAGRSAHCAALLVGTCSIGSAHWICKRSMLSCSVCMTIPLQEVLHR